MAAGFYLHATTFKSLVCISRLSLLSQWNFHYGQYFSVWVRRPTNDFRLGWKTWPKEFSLFLFFFMQVCGLIFAFLQPNTVTTYPQSKCWFSTKKVKRKKRNVFTVIEVLITLFARPAAALYERRQRRTCPGESRGKSSETQESSGLPLHWGALAFRLNLGLWRVSQGNL